MARIVTVVARLIEEIEPDAVVIACNTASTLALPQLRAAMRFPSSARCRRSSRRRPQTQSRHHRRAGDARHGAARIHARR